VTTGVENRTYRAIAVCLGAALALAAIDIGSKLWALDALSHARLDEAPPICVPDEHGRIEWQRIRGEKLVVVPGYLELSYAENCGAAFGLMRGAPIAVRRVLFAIAAILASAVLVWMFARGRGGQCFAVAVPFVVAGALGNLFDRLRYGYVVDFVRFHVEEGFEWPTFNGADIAITVGVTLLVLDGFIVERKRRIAERARARARAAADEDEEEKEGAESTP